MLKTKENEMAFIDDCTEMGRQKLRELLAQCTDEQIKVFNLMYKSVDEIPAQLMTSMPDLIEIKSWLTNRKR